MLFTDILWGFRGCATDQMAFCDTKCVSGENFGRETEAKFSGQENDNWFDIFLKGKGGCYASRYAVQYMCSHMGIKALACRKSDANGQTLVFADGKFYLIITGYNEPKPRKYTMYEISGAALERLAGENLIDLNYFYI